MALSTQQKIDCLNTIINERESAVWLKEVLQDVLKYKDELANREDRYQQLETHYQSRQADLNGLEKVYQSKNAVLEAQHQETRQTYQALLEKAKADYEEQAEKMATRHGDLKDKMKAAEDKLAKAERTAAAADRQRALIETQLAKAIKDYEDFKAAL